MLTAVPLTLNSASLIEVATVELRVQFLRPTATDELGTSWQCFSCRVIVPITHPYLTDADTLLSNGAQHNVPATTPDLRSRVVEILSATANGCLTELGYFPGMPQRMIEIERLNAKWQSENIKLFQDNQKLARLLQESERSKAITGSDDQRTRVMHALEEQVRVLKEEKTHLLKQAEVFRHDYIKLSNMYGAARSEVNHLRRHIQQHLHPTSRQVNSDQAGNVSMLHNSPNSQLYQIAQAQQNQRPMQVYNPNQTVPVAAPYSLPPVNTGKPIKYMKCWCSQLMPQCLFCKYVVTFFMTT